ncbi:hypothetical protein CLV63_1339 [Murinocardiopsis flavida]|uniref:VOC domain-containing protein n=1 Tax=Murinocardiopsis flavida TaxID=645275 RepID=A0A2P8CPL5_9ACTN|nr:VOC family protein [Murinocardiopsis flavida]PSK86892.1 hypothetical protein CLV63_1339 [Murinocardiopsis flavida]
MAWGAVEQIVVDAADPAALARFWAVLLGGEPVDRDDGWSVIGGGPGRPRVSFQPVPEPKARKNRLHLDIAAADIPAATAALVTAGAIAVGAQVTDEQGTFQVLRDPEGNEFCLAWPPKP